MNFQLFSFYMQGSSQKYVYPLLNSSFICNWGIEESRSIDINPSPVVTWCIHLFAQACFRTRTERSIVLYLNHSDTRCSTLEINSGHKNKKIGFYPKSLRPFLKILCVVHDSKYMHKEEVSLHSARTPSAP